MEFEFLCIARFNFQKGQDILLRAVGLAQEKLRASAKRTLLIGGGETLDECRRLAETLGIADLVTFAGEIPDAVSQLGRARILVSPSRWEGLPILLLEAGRAGSCVIASDCPGNVDILRPAPSARRPPPAPCGILFPEGDVRALANALAADRGDEEIARLGENLRRRVAEDYARADMLSATRALYGRVVQGFAGNGGGGCPVGV